MEIPLNRLGNFATGAVTECPGAGNPKQAFNALFEIAVTLLPAPPSYSEAELGLICCIERKLEMPSCESYTASLAWAIISTRLANWIQRVE